MALKLLFSLILSLISFAFASVKDLSYYFKPAVCTVVLPFIKLFEKICLPQNSRTGVKVTFAFGNNYTTTFIKKNYETFIAYQSKIGLNYKMQIIKPACIFSCSSICLSCGMRWCYEFFDTLYLKWERGNYSSG